MALAVSSCLTSDMTSELSLNSPEARLNSLIPLPSTINKLETNPFLITEETGIYVSSGNEEVYRIGEYLASILRPSTGFEIEIGTAGDSPPAGSINLVLSDEKAALGNEGYELMVTEEHLTLTASQPAGLFRGIQTIRQLLPPTVESSTVQPGSWEIAAVEIIDTPRFDWRGAMLDVTRHFFSVDDVKRYIDLLSYYKINRLHLHLSDDQGWRVMINSWPRLAEYGGSTEVGGGEGGYYTQEAFAEIVSYADERFITIVPEIDMPGHTNAALASYAELNCDDTARELYTGIDVGFSSLCVNKEITYKFVDDVVRELAALTTGPYFHIGGDEVQTLDEEEYTTFIERVVEIVQSHGKQPVGWYEIAQADLVPGTTVQFWAGESADEAIQKGAKLIMSPASKAYVDMKYDEQTPLGLNWAGNVSVETAYSWDPADIFEGISEENILGVEAPLWTETIETMDDIEYMAFPRIPGIAEIGWSSTRERSWDEYKVRLGLHGPRLAALEVDYYASPDIPWAN